MSSLSLIVIELEGIGHPASNRKQNDGESSNFRSDSVVSHCLSCERERVKNAAANSWRGDKSCSEKGTVVKAGKQALAYPGY